MKVFNNLVLDLEVDLDGNEYAVNRLAKLEQMWKEVLDEFLIHKKQISNRIRSLKKN